MKKLILLTAIASLLSFTPGSDYSEGWKTGYKIGWCHSEGYGCYAPMPPYPPYPPYGRDNYQSGYNDGFLYGINDRARSGY